MVDAHSNKGDIHTHISFLARNAIYTNEKPYITTFPVGNIPGAKATNHTIETKPITVHDLRHSDVNLDLDTNGACLLKATTSLQQQDASDAHTPSMETFINEILVILQGNFPEYSDIRPMDFQVRTSHTSTLFPTLMSYSFENETQDSLTTPTRARNSLNLPRCHIRTFPSTVHTCASKMCSPASEKRTRPAASTSSSEFPQFE